MAAAKFSRDVLEMFYGPIEENQRLRPPISPTTTTTTTTFYLPSKITSTNTIINNIKYINNKIEIIK